MQAKGITSTLIFEGAALNRDEKIGGNILSIKKLSTSDGVHSFIGRSAIRYSLFTTLHQLFGWEEAPVKQTRKVVQFDFPSANIVTYPEMDIFGYMSTASGDKDSSVIRKAPLGITKAVSLEPWRSDMAFYANHDMVRRLRAQGEDGEPNPYQKEEHYSWYKLSFSIDLARLGYQELFVPDKTESFKAYIDGLNSVDKNQVELGERSFLKDEVDEWYQISGQGYVGTQKMNNSSRVVFVVREEERSRRLMQLLTVIKNGIMYHASTENYGIVPLLNVTASLKIPVPLFHAAIEIKQRRLDVERLNYAMQNDYLLQAYIGGPMSADISGINNSKVGDWSALLDSINLAGTKE
jgi:CRISPR-associated protein Cst2